MAPRDVVAVTSEIFRREFPVARHDPFVDAADHLDTTLTAVKERVEVPSHFAKILAQRRRRRIKGGEPQALVIVDLRHCCQAPAVAIQFIVVGLFHIGHADKPAVITVGPAVIGAGKRRGIAGIGTAQAVAAMAADVEERAHLPSAVTQDQDRVFAHIGSEEIAGLRDLAVVAQKQPAARENALQLLLVDVRLDENAAADKTILVIDQSVYIHWTPPVTSAAAFAASPRHRPSGSFR